MNYGQKFQILDSFAFLPTGLAKLTDSLCKTRKIQKRKLEFLAMSDLVQIGGEYDDEVYQLCLGKLVFPFQLTESIENILLWTCLPPKKYFVSTLTGESISQKNYNDILQLWRKKKFANLLELYKFYCSLGT